MTRDFLRLTSHIDMVKTHLDRLGVVRFMRNVLSGVCMSDWPRLTIRPSVSDPYESISPEREVDLVDGWTCTGKIEGGNLALFEFGGPVASPYE